MTPIGKSALIAALAIASALSAPIAQARRGADDAPGDVRHSRGADDAPGHVRQGRGADDAPGRVRQGRGADDTPGDDRQNSRN